jgi:enoyl-CoA hydratase/carnithine racemase
MSLVEIRSVGRACVLTLSRPEKLNALSTALERELKEALDGEAVSASACVVFAGAGRAFSAGADVTEFRDRDPAAIASYYRDTGDVYERVARLPQPTVSAIHGYCLGGGLELALATDFRVAEESTSFGFPEVSLGLAAGSGGIYRLVRLVGPARAKELLLLRPRFSAAEARELGLVTEVVPEGQALERALELAEQLAELPPLAVSVVKQAADVMPEVSREAGILLERIGYAMLAQTRAAQDAAEAFGPRARPPA